MTNFSILNNLRPVLASTSLKFNHLSSATHSVFSHSRRRDRLRFLRTLTECHQRSAPLAQYPVSRPSIHCANRGRAISVPDGGRFSERPARRHSPTSVYIRRHPDAPGTAPSDVPLRARNVISRVMESVSSPDVLPVSGAERQQSGRRRTADRP